MRIVFLIFSFSIILAACKNPGALIDRNPRKETFKYYDKDTLKSRGFSRLRLNRKYVLQHADTAVTILIFFEDGFLNKYFTTSVDAVPLEPSRSGSIMGYFQTKGDSIFFTTKSYYQKSPASYTGVIRANGIDLWVKYPRAKSAVEEKYILY